jgi:RNase P/RNase MRP subunit POP5
MKPSERFKRRYVSFSLALDGRPAANSDARRMVHEHFLAFFGELGVSSLAFKLMEYREKDGRGIIRCARDRTEEAIFCMACASSFEGKECRMEPLSTSGSARRA